MRRAAPIDLPSRSFSPGWFYATIAAGSIGMAMTAPITALYARELGASQGLAALIVSTMALSFLCLDLVASRVVPRIDARSALIGGYLVFGVGSFISAAAPNLAVMTGARVLQGFAVAFPMGAGFHMALRLAERGREGRELARFNSSAFVGMAVGPLIVGAVASIAGGLTGMRWGFFTCGIVNLLTALIAWRALPSIPSVERPEFGLPSREIFAGRRTRYALLASGLGFGLRGVAGMTLLPLLGEDIGAGVGGVALATMFMSVSELAGIQVSGRLADVHGRRPIVLGSALASVVVLLAVLGRPTVGLYLGFAAVLGVVLSALRVVPAAMVVDVAANDETAAMGWRIASDVSSLGTAVVTGTVLSVVGIYGGFVYAAATAGLIGILAVLIGETLRVGVPAAAAAADDAAPCDELPGEAVA